MTDTPDTSGRRPPTIELTATEVAAEGTPPHAETPESGPAETPGSEAPRPEQAGASPTEASAEASAAATAAGAWRGRSVFGAFAAGVVGGLATVAAIAGLWLANLLPLPPTASVPPPQSGNAETAAAAAIAVISGRLDKIEKALQARPSETRPTDSAAAAGLASLQAETKSLSDSLVALNRRADDITAAAQDARKRADTAAGAADAAKSAAAGAAEQAVQHSDFDALGKRVSELESAIKTLAAAAARQAAGSDDRAARRAIAAEALRAAVERGAPFAAELAAVRSLGGVDDNAAAALQKFSADGVPSATSLAHELQVLLPALTRATEPAELGTTFLERLENSAQKLVRMTPLEAPRGDDPAAVTARIELAASHNDIDAALTEFAKLPEAARTAASVFIGKAQARQNAITAARQIAAAALAALRAPVAQ